MKAVALSELASWDRTLKVVRGPDVSVTGLGSDSRRVREGDLFACLAGTKEDGSRYARAAAQAGARAFLAEKDPGLGEGLLLSPDPRKSLSFLASRFHGNPSASLDLVGVTGTNGKTTTAHLVASVLTAWGKPAGFVGTVGAHFRDFHEPLDNTTPASWDVQAILASMRSRGAEAAAMEVSSHALDQGRCEGLRFRGGVFTNLTRDHLDYHKDFQAYRDAKGRLFRELLGPSDWAVANADDPESARVLEGCRARILWYGLDPKADVRMEEIQVGTEGLRFRQGGDLFESPLLGRFNLWNLGAAVAVGRAFKMPAADIAFGLKALRAVPGRMEPVDEGQDFLVLVDYAHTPDAVEKVLNAARDFAKGRVLVAFGCGGDRDRGKRPAMGRIAASLADVAVVTSDNPRSEDPGAIIQDILGGITEGRGRLRVQPDRELAIRDLVQEARPGDVAVIAGKGHEDYQIVAGVKHHFDDREQARSALKTRLHGSAAR